MANKELLIEMMAAIRSQMRVLDFLLEAAQNKLNTPEETAPQRICPECSSDVTDITTFGCTSPQFCCVQCPWRGPIEGIEFTNDTVHSG